MLYLLDTSHDLDICAAELEVCPSEVGQLLTPLSRFSNRGHGRFAIDNGAFKDFSRANFMSLLERERKNVSQCVFVVAPDVPMSARRTLELFHAWYPALYPWPLALACQNGQEDLPMPWDLIAAVFIAGDDRWKVSTHALAIVHAAQSLGKWVHMGRVNGPVRFDVVNSWGVDSIDGTGISLFTEMRRKIASYRKHPKLDLCIEADERMKNEPEA